MDDPPQDHFAEVGVLGAAIDGDASIVANLLVPEDFYKPAHGVIYDAAIAAYRSGGVGNGYAVVAELERRGQLDDLGGAMPVLALRDMRSYNVTHDAKIVAEKAMLRRVIALGHRFVQGGYQAAGGGDYETLMARVQTDYEDLLNQQRGRLLIQRANPNDLTFRKLADVAVDVDSRPARPWLFEPVCVAGDYGVMSAQDKAGKTWAILDAAVSCASGTAWLDQFQCRSAGPVVAFLGEGSDAKMLRRIRAVGAHKGMTRAEVDALPITLCFRAPQLSNAKHLALIAAQLEEDQAVLGIIDPLYLSAGGANGADLYAMGALLGNIQAIAQAHGSSLLIAHHWNKTGEGNGHNRSSGVGPGAWGRFLISVGVVNTRTDEVTKETTVRLGWAFKGDEIPETEMTLVRRVRADNPADLNSPLHYRIERVEDSAEGEPGSDEFTGLRPAARRVVLVLRAAQGALTVEEIGDQLASDGTGMPLKKRTIQDALKTLSDTEVALAHEDGMRGFAQLWSAVVEEDQKCA